MLITDHGYFRQRSAAIIIRRTEYDRLSQHFIEDKLAVVRAKDMNNVMVQCNMK